MTRTGSAIGHRPLLEVSCSITALLLLASVLVVLVPSSSGPTPLSNVGTTTMDRPAQVSADLPASSDVRSVGSSFAWTNVTPAGGPGPSARSYAAMAYDPTDGELVLFGGLAGTTSETLGDTWTYANGTWTNLTAQLTSSPSPRSGAGMAYDPTRGGVLLFGGMDATGQFLNDSWEFRGNVWTNVTAAPGAPVPPRLYLPTLTTDTSDNLVLLFGGDPLGGYGLGTTWTWGSKGWSNVTSSVGAAPSPRFDNVGADDPADHGALLFGGFNGNTTVYNDTWLFSAGTWRNVTAPHGFSPPKLLYPAFDEVGPNGTLLLTEGALVGPSFIPTLEPYTWAWSSGAWTNLSGASSPASPPNLRTNAAQAEVYAGGGGYAAVFGGQGPTSSLSDLELLHADLVATATAAPTLLNVNGSLGYTATVQGGVPPITSSWSFGDGSHSSALSGTHPYLQAGTFAVSFSARDAVGEAVYRNFTVDVVSQLTVQISEAPSPVDVGVGANFTSLVAGGSAPYTYLWDFGDSHGSSPVPDPSYPFAGAGNYTATLVVQDALGHTGRASVAVQVVRDPSVAIEAPTHEAPGDTIAFGSSAWGGQAPYTYLWSFGDGSSSSSARSTHSYESAGTYRVSLEVWDSLHGSNSSSQTEEISSASEVVQVTVSAQPSSGTEGSTVFHFFANATGGTAPYQLSWATSGGGTGQGSEFNHTFTSAGTWTVWANATDALGVTGGSSAQVVVAPPSSGSTTPPSSSSSALLSTPDLLLAIALAAVLAAGTAVALVYHRRRGRAPKDPGSAQAGVPPTSNAAAEAGGSPPAKD